MDNLRIVPHLSVPSTMVLFSMSVFAVPPSIEEGETEFTANEGSTIQLPCEVEGDPRPKIIWTKGGVRISDTDPHYFINEDGSLDIFSVKTQDTATYVCTAINQAGSKEKRVTLFVQRKYHRLQLIAAQ